VFGSGKIVNNLMIGINGKKLTPSEFRGVYLDVLKSDIKEAFNTGELLLFVTYQPLTTTFDPKEVSDFTFERLSGFNYIEVLEQNFETSRMKNNGKYSDGYHSHILLKESDFDTVKNDLKGFNIKEKTVYDLDRLTEKYLIKQKGITPYRERPFKNIPKPRKLEIEKPIFKNDLAKALKPLIVSPKAPIRFVQYQFRKICNWVLNLLRTTNKAYWLLMFVNDS
jgi:hypothetical protein